MRLGAAPYSRNKGIATMADMMVWRYAFGVDQDGQERRFTVYPQGEGFIVLNERQHRHDAGRRLDEQDVIEEIELAFQVREVRLRDPLFASLRAH